MYKQLFLLVGLISLAACEQPGEFAPGPQQSIFDIAALDTFQVESSTVLIDSILTSDITRLLVGHVTDPDLGSIRASSYFKLGPSASLAFQDRHMVYDSLYLVLYFDGYSFGDDTGSQRFSVREVVEEFAANEDDLYYDYDRLIYSRALLASFHYDPEWERGDSVAIRLSDELGEKLFQMAEDGEVTIGNSEFEREFEGLVLLPELGSTGQVIGFANSTNPTGIDQQNYISLRMYYHEEGEFSQNYEFEFLQSQPTKAFNAFEPDRTQTLLAGLDGEEPLPAEASGDMTFIQAASGIQTKIRFPSVDQLNKLDLEYIVNTAVLRLEPAPGSYRELSELPDSLALYLTDKYNQVGGVTFNVSGGNSVAQYSMLEADDERGLFAYYEFDITEFIFQQLRDRNQNELALLVAPTAEAILGGVDQLKLAGQDHPVPGINLEIYLTKIIN